jgi:integrase
MPQTRNRRAGVEDRWTRADGQPSARHGKGLRWLGRYVDDEGHERTKSFRIKVEAQAWLAEQTAALVTGTHVDPARAKITFGEFYRLWAPSQVWEAGTRAGMDQAVAAVTFGDVPMGKLDEHHLQTWVKAMVDDGRAPSTIHSRFGSVRVVIRAAMRGRRRVLTYDPCENIRLPAITGRLRIPTPAEVRQVLDEAPTGFTAAVALAAFAGCRDGEVRGLRVSDVRFLQREVNIEFQAGRAYDGAPAKVRAPKRGSERTVAVSERLTAIVSEHLVHAPGVDPDRWLFPGVGAKPASASAMNRRWSLARAGLDWPMHFHDLRHFYASGLIAAGCDVKTVQHALGHKSATMTLNTYGHLWPDGDERARKAGDALVSQVLGAATADQLRTEGSKMAVDQA